LTEALRCDLRVPEPGMRTLEAMGEKPPTGESHRVLLAVGNVAEGDSLAGWLGYEGFPTSTASGA
jgi:hypothetical protein